MIQSATLSSASQHYQATLEEVRREACRWIALSLCPVGALLVLGAGSFRDPLHGAVLGGLTMAISLLAWRLTYLSHWVGAWWLVAGCAAVNLLALQWYPLESVVLLLALPAGLATLLLGLRSGALVAAFLSLIMLGKAQLLLPLPTSPLRGGTQIAALVATWGTLALVWISSQPVQRAIEWPWVSYERARRLLEEAREQRMELKQVQEDLYQANQELARLSDRLKAMAQAAEEARRVKEEFVANVSHELRTPLNMIIGFSEMITQAPQVYGAELPPALLADIAAIQRNSQHLASLVDDVLDLSQIEAGRMALSKEWASIQEIIEAAVSAVQPLFESKGLSLEIEVPPDLPALFCDSMRIRQVMLNLLSNAGRFTEKGGVQVRAWREGEDIVVSVADTGPGIALEDQERLFEPFQQLDGSIRRRHGGSGLGLSISKRFVEMHKGRMWLESEVGVGTTVYFSLPLSLPAPAVLVGNEAARWFSFYHQYEPRTRRSKAPPPKPAPRFVLLERGETLQRLLGRYMEGVEFVSVRDMDEALRELSRSPAQALIVNDSALKQMPSWMGRLAHLPYGTPAVVCWVPGEDEAAQQLGVVRYLIKPVTRDALLSVLEDLGRQVRTVLLVDDEPEALQLFARMLSSARRGYRVLRAPSGRRALDLLRERQPDVMILDLVMPGMNGFDVLREKSRDPVLRQIPVVVISARDPTGEPIVSNTLTITRSGGLSVRDLVTCIQAVSEVLSPSTRSDGQGRPEKPVG